MTAAGGRESRVGGGRTAWLADRMASDPELTRPTGKEVRVRRVPRNLRGNKCMSLPLESAHPLWVTRELTFACVTPGRTPRRGSLATRSR
eukprot:6802050-Prymnesium_polylepis.1